MVAPPTTSATIAAIHALRHVLLERVPIARSPPIRNAQAIIARDVARTMFGVHRASTICGQTTACNGISTIAKSFNTAIGALSSGAAWLSRIKGQKIITPIASVKISPRESG